MFPYRYLMWGIAFCCLTSIASNHHIFNFSVLCMEKDPTGIVHEGNRTYNKFDYTESDKSFINGALGMGALLATFPVNKLSMKYGVRIVFFVCGLISAISTALIPLAANRNFKFFVFLRFLQGIGYASDFAAIGVICIRWASLKEYSVFIASMTAFGPIATATSNALTAAACTKESPAGWSLSYYIHAVAGFVLFVVWYFVYSDEPRECKRVTEKELDDIHEGKSKAHIDGDKYVPYKEIMKNRVILVVWFNAFVEMMSVIFLIINLPTYMHKVLEFDLETSGTLMAIFGLVLLPFKVVFAFASDKLKFLSERTKMIIFNNISVGLCGILIAVIGFLSADHKVWSIVLLCVYSSAMSANCGGFYKCGTVVARQHAHFVVSTIQVMKCIALLTTPVWTLLFVRDENKSILSEWRVIFLIHSGFMIAANSLFWAINSDQAAEFTKLTGPPTKENNSVKASIGPVIKK